MSKLEKLVAFVAAHHAQAEVRNGELWVLNVYGFNHPDVWEKLPATWQAVRVWLGY